MSRIKLPYWAPVVPMVGLPLAGLAVSVWGTADARNFTSNLTSVEVGEGEQQIPATKFDLEGGPTQVVELEGQTDVELALKEGLNVLEMTCATGDRESYNYDFHSAEGEIQVGQSQDIKTLAADISIKRANGQILTVSNQCKGYEQETTVFINVDR